MTNDPVQNVLSRLECVRQTGADRWQARCPAHEDETPSLSVRRADDGKVLLKCQAGCETPAVVAALRLHLSDLFADGAGAGGNGARVQAKRSGSKAKRRYRTAEAAAREFARRKKGTVEALYKWSTDWFQARIRTDSGKEFCAITRNGDAWLLKGPKKPHPLYRVDEVGVGDLAYVVEGEAVVEAGLALGLTTTTSGGATSAKAADWTPLGGKRVVILPDNDAAGCKYAKAVVAELFGLESPPTDVRIVELPGLPDSGDLVEFVEERDSRTSEQIVAELEALVAASKPISPPKAQNAPAEEGSDNALSVGHPDNVARVLVATDYTQDGLRTLARYRGDWLFWNGTSYEVVSDEDFRARVRHFLSWRKLIRARRRKDEIEWVTVKPNRYITNEVLDATRALVNVPDKLEQPTWLSPTEDDTLPEDVIAFQNGLFDLSAERVIEHTPRWFSRNVLPFNYAPGATCRLWSAFLKDVSCDDDEWVRALRLWIGYLLVPDTRQQKLLILHGPKRSGKGTICRTIERILGAHNVCSSTLSSLGTRFGLAPLIGKTAAILPDAHLGHRADAQAIVETLKSIVGEDSQTVDRKHRDPITTRLRVRFTISVNQLMNLPDASDALTARCIILPLEQSYLGREDLDLDDKLAGEAPGILNWSLAGLRDLRKHGRLIQPARGRDVVADLGRLVSPVRALVEDLCALDAGNEVPIRELYEAWCTWCERHGHKSGSDAVFGAKLRSAYPQIKRARPRAVPGDDTSRRTAYRGVAIDYAALSRLRAGEIDQSGPAGHSWP